MVLELITLGYGMNLMKMKKDIGISSKQIKSTTYGNKHKQEHFICPIVSYELLVEGINYNMPDDALTEPQESEVWNSIKQRTQIRYNNRNMQA